jgi:hypothetical protein
MSKIYKVDLSAIGVKRKTVSNGQLSLEIFHGQKMNENIITDTFPKFFKEISEEIGEAPAKEFETTKTEEKIVDAIKEVEEKVEIVEEKAEEIVEEIAKEEIAEEIAEDEEPAESKETIIENAKKFRTKADLEKYGINYGIDLNKQKSLKNMIKDFVAHIEG